MNSVAIVISKRVHSQIMYESEDRQSKGTVSVEVFQGRLRVRLPRQLFDGKQKYLTLGLSDTKINLKISNIGNQYAGFTRAIALLPSQNLKDSIMIRDWIIANKPPSSYRS